MNVILPETVSAKKKKLLIKELLQGKEYATQLKLLLKNPVCSDGSPSVKELVANVLRSFSETISVMNSTEDCSLDVNDSGSLVEADDLKSEDTSESKKRLSPTTKDRRGSYKRRYCLFCTDTRKKHVFFFFLHCSHTSSHDKKKLLIFIVNYYAGRQMRQGS